MSRRRRATLSPTLFPFLAVLICTLGTLILLLALVAQKADETAEQAARKKAANQLDTSQAIAKQQWLRAELVSMRDRQTEVLERRRSELAHLEEHQRKLRRELKLLQSEIEAAEQPAVDTPEHQMVISALKEQIEVEREHIEKLKAEVNGRRPRVIITAHEGPYGTERRPIYVECTDDAIILQPEGSRIELGQLAGALGPGNPLDAALRAIRLYWQKTEPQSPAPYPLLVVRPGGIAAYAAARKAMASWDEQFGYELVPEELELAFPKADQGLRREIDVAIREAATRQYARIASAKRSSGDSFSRRGQPRVLSAAGLSRRGSGADGRHFGRAVDPQDTATRSRLHPDDIRDFDNAMKAATADAPAFGSGGMQPGQLAGTGSGSPQAGEAASADAGAAAGVGPSRMAGAAANAQVKRQGGSLDADHMFGAWTSSGEGNAFGEVGSSGDGDSPGDHGSAGDRGSAEGQGSGNTRSQSSAGPTSGQTGPGGPSAVGSSATPQAGGDNGDGAADQPQATSSPSGRQPSDSNQRLRRNGREWALPDNVKRTRGSAIERRIEVKCRADAFVLAPERAGLVAREFPIHDRSVEEAAMELATVVHDRVESWGVALASGRWQPILRVTVQPGAERRFHELQALLDGSGLNIEQR